MAPMTPHFSAELWELRRGGRVHAEPWPLADRTKAVHEAVTMVVQDNGKVRDRIEVSPDITEADAEALALASARVQELLAGSAPRKVIVRAPKLVNVVA